MRGHPEAGETNPLLVSTILLAILTVAFGGVMAWALINYFDQKNNVDQIVAREVSTAKKEQQALDEKDFLEREKQPYRQYAGPSDLGSVKFDFPKTWSVYEDNPGSGGELEAYFHPDAVQSIDNRDQVFALQVRVLSESYDEVLDGYERSLGDDGLSAKPFEVNDYKGMRLSGSLDDSHRGVIVLFKIRDKTLEFTVNHTDYIKDLDNVVLKTLSYNP